MKIIVIIVYNFDSVQLLYTHPDSHKGPLNVLILSLLRFLFFTVYNWEPNGPKRL